MLTAVFVMRSVLQAQMAMLSHSFCVLIAEFLKVLSRTALGFVVMGFIGFFVKLLFIVRAAMSGS